MEKVLESRKPSRYLKYSTPFLLDHSILETKKVNPKALCTSMCNSFYNKISSQRDESGEWSIWLYFLFFFFFFLKIWNNVAIRGCAALLCFVENVEMGANSAICLFPLSCFILFCFFLIL